MGYQPRKTYEAPPMPPTAPCKKIQNNVICEGCGAPLKKDLKFCEYCGRSNSGIGYGALENLSDAFLRFANAVHDFGSNL